MRPAIGVLFGGCSPEYEISLKSAHGVLTHLDTTRYRPVLIGLTRDGQWRLFAGDPARILDDTWLEDPSCRPAVISPDRQTHGLLVTDGSQLSVLHLDAALPLLHGRNGEDGTVQGLLELAGIPVIGCGSLASALSMDKHRAHQIVAAAGIRTPQAFTARRTTDPRLILTAVAELGYPVFVKPVRAGSSFGLSKVEDPAGLPAALRLAWDYDEEAIIEEAIAGFEVGCAIVGTDDLVTGVVDEVELGQAIYDYAEKYHPSVSRIHVPARIPAGQAEAVKRSAVTVYRALGCSGFARVDLFITPSGRIVFNEVNTIPGLTPVSRFPRMLNAVGLDLGQLIGRAIDQGLARAGLGELLTGHEPVGVERVLVSAGQGAER